MIHPAMLALTGAYAPWIIGAGDTPDWSPWQMPKRRLAEYQLVLITAGEGEVKVAGHWRQVHEGQAFLLQPNILADIGSRTGNHPTWVSFDVIYNPRRGEGPLAHAYDDELGRRKPWLQPAPRQVWGVDLPLLLPDALAGRCATILPALVRSWRSGVPDAVLQANHVLAGLLLDLVTQARGGTEPELDDDDPEPAIVAAESAMRARLHEGIGVDDFARAAGLTRSRFCAIYPRLRGHTPGVFLRRARIALAEVLLAGGETKAAVAKAIGVADGTVLTRMLRAASQ